MTGGQLTARSLTEQYLARIAEVDKAGPTTMELVPRLGGRLRPSLRRARARRRAFSNAFRSRTIASSRSVRRALTEAPVSQQLHVHLTMLW